MDSDSTQSRPPQQLVQEGYDAMAKEYLKWATQKQTPREDKIKHLLGELKNQDATILELGCGAGIPGTQLLAQQCQKVIANDISEAQILSAKTALAQFDNVEFVHGDMMALAFEPATLNAIVALYSLFHLPRDEQKIMVQKLFSWLAPTGMLLCNLGVANDPGSVSDWLGTKMFWSQFDAATNLEIIRQAGFEVVSQEIIEEMEDGRLIPFQWIIARKY